MVCIARFRGPLEGLFAGRVKAIPRSPPSPRRPRRHDPGGLDVVGDGRDADARGDVGEHGRARAAHPVGVARHDLEARADQRGEVDLVDHEQIGLRDAGAALARHLVAVRDVDDIDRIVGELAAVLRGEVVAAALDDQELGGDGLHQVVEREQVRRDVLADRGVRAAAGLDGADPGERQGLVPGEELGVLAREDVVGHHAERAAIAKRAAQRQHERGLAAADRAADPDGERALREVAGERPRPLVEPPGVLPDLVVVVAATGVIVVAGVIVHPEAVVVVSHVIF